MSLNMEIYAPVNVPINWQSEQITQNEQRYLLLNTVFSKIEQLAIKPSEWPMGYGSMEHDNLSILYQPAAIFEIHGFTTEQDVNHAQLYVYDSCLAILHIGMSVNTKITEVNDLAITNRVEALSKQYLAPILKQIYSLKTQAPMVQPGAYKFFYNDEEKLTNAEPLWVARMLLKSDDSPYEFYLDWLKSIDSESEVLLLGSGNSLLKNSEYFSDVNRVMVMSQFHCALMSRIEDLLKDNLRISNEKYYHTKSPNLLKSSVSDQQYRNDHIEFIDIQISAASSGVQGKRRELLQQFSAAWDFKSQHDRVTQLTKLTQRRLDRLSQDKLRQQNRGIQTLLAFLGSLGIISLVIDLISIDSSVPHGKTTGLFDIMQFVSAEHIINLMFIFVILLTFYFYKNHE